MLYLIGLGLHDVEDITIKGLKIVKKCARVYLEAYTSILGVGKDQLVSEFSSSPLVLPTYGLGPDCWHFEQINSIPVSSPKRHFRFW